MYLNDTKKTNVLKQLNIILTFSVNKNSEYNFFLIIKIFSFS